MIENELKQLKFSNGQRDLPAFVPDRSPLMIEPKAMEIPDALVPQLDPSLIAFHLGLDDPDVSLCGHPRDRMQLGHVMPHSIEDSPLELEQIRIDAQPVAGVLPVLGLNVLTLQRSRRCIHQGQLAGRCVARSPS